MGAAGRLADEKQVSNELSTRGAEGNSDRLKKQNKNIQNDKEKSQLINTTNDPGVITSFQFASEQM